MLMILLTAYVIGALTMLVVMGYLSATIALASRETMSTGMLQFAGSATARHLTTALIWPLVLSYMLSYTVMIRYIIFLNNRELKKNGARPMPPPLPEADPEDELTPVTTGPYGTGLN